MWGPGGSRTSVGSRTCEDVRGLGMWEDPGFRK